MSPSSIDTFVCRLALLLAFLGFFAPMARAQDRLVVGGTAPTAEAGAVGHFGDNLGPRPDWALGPFIGGGRYAVEDRGTFNLATGAGTAPVVRDVSTGAAILLDPGWISAVDPILPRVFVLRGSPATAELVAANLATGTATVLGPAPVFQYAPALGAPYQALPEVQYAQNAGLLFVRRGAPGGAPELVVLDAMTGALLRALPDTSTRPDGQSSLDGPRWLVDPEGTRLALHREVRVDVRDGVTGALTGGTPVTVAPTGFGAPPFTALVPDWVSGRVLAFQGQPNNWVLSLVTSSGQLLGETINLGYCRPVLKVSAHTGRGYLLYNTGGGGKYYGAILTELASFNASTVQVTDVRDITSAFGFSTDLCGGLALNLATAPGAPRGLTAAVAGSDVTLSWTNVGDATNFVLEVGLAPGRTDLSFAIGAAAPVTLHGAPPGTYYLRVRGTNAFGVSRPSNELSITVP